MFRFNTIVKNKPRPSTVMLNWCKIMTRRHNSFTCFISLKIIVQQCDDNVIIMSSLCQVDKSGDEKDDGSEIKLPPLVKSDSVKSSGKSASSKSSTGSFYLKSPKYTIWGQSNVESVLTDYGYSPNEMLQRPGKHERQSTAKKVQV